MKIVELEQGTNNWKTWRNQKITATDVAVILDMSPWGKTPLQLWKEKTGFELPETANSAMSFGLSKEEEIREHAAAEYGTKFMPVCIEHRTNSWAAASLDGYSEEKNMILEIKTCNFLDHITAINKKIPKKYYPQIQWQIYCSGLDSAIYASFHKDDIVYVEVEKDEKFINDALIKCEEFYTYLTECIPPPKTTKDFEKVEEPEAFIKAQQYKEADELEKEAKKRKEILKKELLEFGDDGNFEIGDLKIYRINQKGRIDYDKLICDYQIDEHVLDKYR